MPSTDNLVENSLERLLSTDVNDLQSINERVLAELERRRNVGRVLGLPTEAIRSVVIAGLEVVPNGNDVDVQGGVLAQDSATLAPLPGTYDSSYRIARNAANLTQVMPAPGGTTFYLLEAQMVEATASELRDIFNTGTLTFAPALVAKVRTREIQLQLLVGGASAPAPTGGDWVPLAIIRRPGGGGAVAASDIIDVRPVTDSGRQRPGLPAVIDGLLAIGPAAANVATLRAAMDGAGGPRSYGLVIGTVDLSAAAVLSPTTVLAASTWYYLYLAPWSALQINPRFADLNGQSEGVLVLSSVAPTTTRRNIAALDLPAPYAVAQAPALSAYCVGAVRRNAANTLFIPIQSADLRHFDFLGGTAEGITLAFLNPPAAGANAVVPPAGSVPAGVRRYGINTRWNGGNAGTSIITLDVTPPGGATVFGPRRSVDDDVAVTPVFFDNEIASGGFGTTSFDLVATVAAPDAASDATLRLTSFDY